jgi:outer membrane biogenesis lipoprotein LolB
MIPILARIIILAALLPTLGACARMHQTVVAAEPVPVAAPMDLESAFKARLQAWENYEARVSLRAQSPKGRFSLKAVVLASPPEKVRLEAFNLWGQTVAALLLDDDRSLIWVPSDRTAYQSPRAEDLLRHFLGISLPPELFVYGLIGSIPPSRLHDFQVVPDLTGWKASSVLSESDIVLNWKILAQPFALESVEAKWKGQTVTISYEPPVALSPGETPQKIRFTSPDWQMDVTVDQIRSVPAFPEESFQLLIPADVRRVDLDGT